MMLINKRSKRDRLRRGAESEDPFRLRKPLQNPVKGHQPGKAYDKECDEPFAC